MTDNSRLTEIPSELRNELPEELADAEIVGTDTAAVDESLRLHGPPGTGKSTQSALRIGSLAVGDADLVPSEMTVVTYRRALANTIRRRLAEWDAITVPDSVDPESADSSNPFRYWTTIHAAASRATDFLSFADSDDWLSGMADARAQREFCRQEGIKFSPPKPWFETRWTVFHSLYQYAKNNLLDVGQYRHIDDDQLRPLRSDRGAEDRLDRFRDEWTGTDFEDVVDRWEEFKWNENDLRDFHEQLEAALVGELPSTRLVVIDEYHDATPLMAAVSERWVDAAETAIVAGDPDQVVNAYAGASPRFFEELDQRVDRDMPVVRLSRSWRCPDEHFQAAARILREEREVPALTTDGPGQILRHPTQQYSTNGTNWNCPDPDSPGSPVQLYETFGDDLMMLTRTQRQADGVAAALDHAGIIYDSQGNDDSQVSVGGDWEMRLKLLRALSILEGVKPEQAEVARGITDFGAGNPRTSSIANRGLDYEDAQTLIDHTHGRYLESDSDEIDQWLGKRREDTIPLTELAAHVTDKFWLRYNSGVDSVNEYTGLSPRDERSLQAAWSRYDRFDIEMEDVNTRVLTIHASKGAEASDVVVFDGITKTISDGISDDPNTRENEARTWYVALTRASERLHIIRNSFEWVTGFLPADLEPEAARMARNAAMTDGGEK